MIPARLLPAALLLAAMLPGAAAAQDGEDPPRIFLEKKVYSDTAGGKQSFFETYTVEKGDTLLTLDTQKIDEAIKDAEAGLAAIGGPADFLGAGAIPPGIPCRHRCDRPDLP
mgnify:CR=1 FL=1